MVPLWRAPHLVRCTPFDNADTLLSAQLFCNQTTAGATLIGPFVRLGLERGCPSPVPGQPSQRGRQRKSDANWLQRFVDRPALHHETHSAKDRHVPRRITFDGDQVGQKSALHSADLRIHM